MSEYKYNPNEAKTANSKVGYGQDAIAQDWLTTEKLYKQQVQEQELIKRLKELESTVLPKIHPITTKEDLEKDLIKAQKELDKYNHVVKRLKEILDFTSNMTFKEGDAAFHREHGNVLIGGVAVNTENLDNSSYSVILKTGKRATVSLDSLVPISEATKILFSKV